MSLQEILCIKGHCCNQESKEIAYMMRGVFAHQSSNEGLISKYLKNTFNSTTAKTQLQNEQRTWIDISPRRSKNGQQHKNRYSSSWVIREIQIKTTMKFYLRPTRMAIIKQKCEGSKNCGVDVEKLEALSTTGGNIKWCGHCAKQFSVSSTS